MLPIHFLLLLAAINLSVSMGGEHSSKMTLAEAFDLDREADSAMLMGSPDSLSSSPHSLMSFEAEQHPTIANVLSTVLSSLCSESSKTNTANVDEEMEKKPMLRRTYRFHKKMNELMTDHKGEKIYKPVK